MKNIKLYLYFWPAVTGIVDILSFVLAYAFTEIDFVILFLLKAPVALVFLFFYLQFYRWVNKNYIRIEGANK
jgi:hypothetical protein